MEVSNTASPIDTEFLILQYTTYFGKYFKESFSRCAYNNCRLATNKLLLNISDVILLSTRNLLEGLPPRRSYNQLWIAITRESPFNNHLRRYANVTFNATATYSKRSEILFDYGATVKRANPKTYKYNPRMYNKTRAVAWLVSRCKKQSNRMWYAKELSRYIKVDIFGACGRLKCPRNRKLNLYKDPCLKRIEDKYKFYLSFENSLCKEYATEKIWKILTRNLVPVVLGAADYSHILPPHSYIDVANFSHPSKLAKYLKLVASSDELYGQYFEWKRTYRVSPHDTPEMLCNVCEYVNTNRWGPHVKAIKMNKFWNAKRHCISPETYFSGMNTYSNKTLSSVL